MWSLLPRLLERVDRRPSRQHFQQSFSHSQAQSVSSLTSDLWDRSSTETPGIMTPLLTHKHRQQQAEGLRLKAWTHTYSPVSNPQVKWTNSLFACRFVCEEHRVFKSHPVSEGLNVTGGSPGVSQMLVKTFQTDSLCVSRPAPVLPGAYHQGVQQQQQQQYHGYMHQTSMSSVRSVTSPPHSGTMVQYITGTRLAAFAAHYQYLRIQLPLVHCLAP